MELFVGVSGALCLSKVGRYLNGRPNRLQMTAAHTVRNDS